MGRGVFACACGDGDDASHDANDDDETLLLRPYPHLLPHTCPHVPWQDMKTALGSDWFFNHPSPLIRCTRGLVYLKEMSLDEFKQHSLDLASKTEALP